MAYNYLILKNFHLFKKGWNNLFTFADRIQLKSHPNGAYTIVTVQSQNLSKTPYLTQIDTTILKQAY